jgi:undecaprenyl-diphosphatase
MLTAVFVVLSAWWVKGPILIGLGLASDVWRRRVPVAFLAAGAAWLVTSGVVDVLKRTFDRARPPEADPSLGGSLVPLPENASFPSGHSATAFAAATAIAILCPKLRPWALVLAAGVALSRIYLRVHFPIDVLVGGLIGASLGAAAGLLALRLIRRDDAAPAAAG